MTEPERPANGGAGDQEMAPNWDRLLGESFGVRPMDARRKRRLDRVRAIRDRGPILFMATYGLGAALLFGAGFAWLFRSASGGGLVFWFSVPFGLMLSWTGWRSLGFHHEKLEREWRHHLAETTFE